MNKVFVWLHHCETDSLQNLLAVDGSHWRGSEEPDVLQMATHAAALVQEYLIYSLTNAI